MFKNLTKFNVQRNAKEATGFFLAYLLFGFILAGLSGGIAGLIYPENAFDAGLIVGSTIPTIYCMFLYFIIYVKKKVNSFLFILIGLITIAIAYLMGMIIPLIIISFLTTREGKFSKAIIDNSSESKTSITENDYVIYPNKGKLFLFVICSLVGIIVSFFMIKENPISSIFCILFSALAFFGISLKLISKKPLVVINDNGIVDNASAIGAGFIKWEDIDDFYIYEVSKQKFLGIVPKDKNMFLSSKGSIKQSVLKINQSMLQAPINIGQSILPVRLEEVFSIMEKHMTKVKNEI